MYRDGGRINYLNHSICYIAAAQEACYQVQTKLLEAEARISSLETVAEDAKRRETGMQLSSSINRMPCKCGATVC